jgi:hypothetical protein
LHSGQSSIDRFVVSRTNGATQPVQKGAMGFVLYGIAPTLGRVLRHKVRELSCDGGRVVVCRDGCVDCHVISVSVLKI